MLTEINVVSFNTGTPIDWIQQYLYSDLMKLGIERDPKMAQKKILEMKESVIKKTDAIMQNRYKQVDYQNSEVDSNIFKEVLKWHDNVAEKVIKEIIINFNPSIICLQEYKHKEKGDEYQCIATILKSEGFVVKNYYDLAVAYKSKEFTFKGGINTFNPNDNSLNDNSLTSKKIFCKPGYFVDLTHNKTNLTLRVITDHVKGFDASVQKNKIRKSQYKKKFTIPNNHEQIMNSLLKRVDHNDAYKGDIALEQSLESIEKTRIVKICSTLEKDSEGKLYYKKMETFQDPDFYVLCIDSNTTLKGVSKKKEECLHPKRLRLINEMRFFKSDLTNGSATIIDHNDFHPRKIDYIFAKSFSSTSEITTKDRILNGINDSNLLLTPNLMMSDHLPVLSTIIYKSK